MLWVVLLYFFIKILKFKFEKVIKSTQVKLFFPVGNLENDNKKDQSTIQVLKNGFCHTDDGSVAPPLVRLNIHTYSRLS